MQTITIDLTDERYARVATALGRLTGKRDENGPRDATVEEVTEYSFNMLRGLATQWEREQSQQGLIEPF